VHACQFRDGIMNSTGWRWHHVLCVSSYTFHFMESVKSMLHL